MTHWLGWLRSPSDVIRDVAHSPIDPDAAVNVDGETLWLLVAFADRVTENTEHTVGLRHDQDPIETIIRRQVPVPRTIHGLRQIDVERLRRGR
jgi:hypothetical protein